MNRFIYPLAVWFMAFVTVIVITFGVLSTRSEVHVEMGVDIPKGNGVVKLHKREEVIRDLQKVEADSIRPISCKKTSDGV